MFANFTENQKQLFWEVIESLPINFDDSKEEDVAYLGMRIESGKSLNSQNYKALHNSTLLLRLLKEINNWKCKPDDLENNEEFNKKKDELVNLLQAALTRKNR
ncbi:hypothetical protein SAMN02910409_0266 [Prevotellaceae bacterium HUN156]|nr:hypothetical protein SAMN02910409_0266 [Prevotellaceae bacterium HUN156]